MQVTMRAAGVLGKSANLIEGRLAAAKELQ